MTRSVEFLFERDAPFTLTVEHLRFTPSFTVPESVLTPVADITGRDKPPETREVPAGLQSRERTPEELREIATLDINPNAGLLSGVPFLENIDPTAGLLQFSQEESEKEKRLRESLEPSMLDRFLGVQRGEIPLTKEIPNPVLRTKDYRPDVILYGPKAGAVTSALMGAGFPLPIKSMEQVRPEAAKTTVGEMAASFGGEVAKYAYLGRVMGQLGLSGFYKWGVAGATSGFERGLVEGKSATEILTTPDIYLEASLAGSPFVAGGVLKQGARFLRKFLKRPIREFAGEPFYLNGKVLRAGEKVERGKAILDPRGEPLIPEDVFGTNSPASKWYGIIRDGLPKIQNDIARFVDNSAAASSFLVALNDDISRGVKGTKTMKDHFIGATRFLWQAKNRGKELEFKQITGLLQQAMEREHIYAGMFLEDLRDAGIQKWARGLSNISGSRGQRLAALLESDATEAFPFRQILDKAHKFASEKGVNVTGYRAGYFPRMIKSEISHKIADDIELILRNAGAKEAIEELGIYLTPKEVNRISKIARSWAAKNKKRPLAQALTHIIEDPKSGIDNYGDALYFLRKQTYEDLFNPFGNLERPRTLPLPDGFYERDATIVLVNYLRGVARRTATVETFGENGEIAANLLKTLSDKSSTEAEIAKQILDSWTGKINVSKNLSSKGGRNLLKTIRAVSEFDVVTKIGFGLSTIPNMTQILISGFLETGFWPTIKGGLSVLSKKNRSAMRRFGILLDTSQDAILGYNTAGAWSNFRNLSLEVSGFAGMNRINQYWSAGIGKYYLEKMYGIANRPIQPLEFEGFIGRTVQPTIPDLATARTDWARRKLSEYGIDWRQPLTDEIKGRFMWRFSNESQLMRNVLREPLAANDPRFRWMFLFKRFGLKQAQLVKEKVWDEFWHETNALPLLRLGAAGYLGGEFVQFSKDRISEIISGQPYYRTPEKNTWEKMINNLASLGGFGVMGDLTATIAQPLFFDPSIEGDDIRDVFRGLKFFGAPVQVQTMADFSRWLSTDGADLIADIDDPIEWREAMSDLAGLLGTISRRLSKRLDTPGRRQNRTKARRNDLLDELRDMAIMADDSSPEKFQSLWDEIYLRLDTWNTAFPEFRIDAARDISPKEIEKKRRREEKRDIERLFPAPLNF